jgi:DNA-binding transcriptional MerR regulator
VFSVTAAPATPESGEEHFTIDELAARTGNTVRNIRFYSTSGLLPPPQRHGRVAVYSSVHRLRLEFIADLQEHGYTLAGIEKVLRKIPLDCSPSDFALHRAMLAPWAPDVYEEISHQELEHRAGRPLDRASLDFLVDLGMLERVSDDAFRTTPRMLSSGLEVLSMKVPLSVLLDAAQVLDKYASAAADGLTEVFRRGIWEPFQRGELNDVDQAQLAAVISRLRPLAVQGLVSAFERASDRAIRQPKG